MRGAAMFGACVMATAASLLLARVHPFGNAGLGGAKAVSAPLMEGADVPPTVRETLVTKCADCHSVQTRERFYDRLAPASWLVERDVVEGRRHMNLSAWESYSPEQQAMLKAKMAYEVKTHQMPLPQYRMIHPSARITDADVQAFAAWARGGPLAETAAASGGLTAGDAANGAKLFEKRCSGCHAMDHDHEGPRLQGVYGRVSGTVADFAYSDALKKAHVVWDESSLERWLADPDAFLPGNNMDFLVSTPQERKDLVAYLKQRSEREGGTADKKN